MTTGPKTARGQITMNRIIKAAEHMFGKQGYYNTSMNEIATKADVAPGTIYIYFDDKYSLYCYLLTQYGHTIRREIAKQTLDSGSRFETERQGLLAFLKLVRKRPYMYNIIWESLYINPALFADYYESFARRYKAQLDLAKGEVTEMDNTVLAYVLMGIANFIGLKYVFFDKNADLEKVVDEVMKVYTQGILRSPQAEALDETK